MTPCSEELNQELKQVMVGICSVAGWRLALLESDTFGFTAA